MTQVLHQRGLDEFYQDDGERHISERAERLERYRFDCIIRAVQSLSMCGGSQRLRVVDAGAGWGQLSIAVAQKGHQVIAIDCADSRLKRFEHQAEELGIVQLQGSIEQTSLPDRAADCVICSEVLEHLPEPAKAIAEFSRITRSGGLLVLSVPNAEALQEPGCSDCATCLHPHGHLHSFGVTDVRQLLEPFSFEINWTAVIGKRITSALVRRGLVPPIIARAVDKMQPTRPSCGWLLVAARKRSA